jgi:hypothetical protein
LTTTTTTTTTINNSDGTTTTIITTKKNIIPNDANAKKNLELVLAKYDIFEPPKFTNLSENTINNTISPILYKHRFLNVVKPVKFNV